MGKFSVILSMYPHKARCKGCVQYIDTKISAQYSPCPTVRNKTGPMPRDPSHATPTYVYRPEKMHEHR